MTYERLEKIAERNKLRRKALSKRAQLFNESDSIAEYLVKLSVNNASVPGLLDIFRWFYFWRNNRILFWASVIFGQFLAICGITAAAAALLPIIGVIFIALSALISVTAFSLLGILYNLEKAQWWLCNWKLGAEISDSEEKNVDNLLMDAAKSAMGLECSIAYSD